MVRRSCPSRSNSISAGEVSFQLAIFMPLFVFTNAAALHSLHFLSTGTQFYACICLQVCVYFQRVIRDLKERTSVVQRAATSALAALECPAFFGINQKFQANKHMLVTPPHARVLNGGVLMAL